MDVQSATNLPVSSGMEQRKTVEVKKEKTTQLDVKIDIQADIYEHTQPEKKPTYEKPVVNPKTIQQLKEETDQAYSQLKRIVAEMLKRQGVKFKEIGNSDTEDFNIANLTIKDLKNLEVDEIAQKEAQAMIDEGGEYSAEKVSDRIVDFAKAISGGDMSKLDLLKSAIEKGFEAAGVDFGGQLPDISKETYDLVMTKLDEWASETDPSSSQPEDGNDITSA